MKKAVIAVVALAAAAGVSIGTLLHFKNKSQQEAEKEAMIQEDNKLFQFEARQIKKLDIVSGGVSYTVELIDDNWVMTNTSADYFDLNQVTLDSVCTFMSTLTADAGYGEATEENKAKYGLDDPYIVTAYDDTSSYTLYIGDLSPTKDFYYAYTADKNNIYAVEFTKAQPVLTDRMLLKNDKFTNYNTNEMVGFTLIKDGEVVYDLKYDSEQGVWTLPDKYKILDVDQSKPSNMANLLSRVTAELMVDESPDDIQTYGFEKPYAEFIITGSDGEKKTILFSDFLGIGNNYIYTYIDEYKQVEAYYTADMDFVDYDIFDLVVQKIAAASFYTVEKIELSGEIVNDEYDFDLDNNKIICRGTEIDLENAELSNFFNTLYDSFSYLYIEGVDISAKPELTDPLFTAKYTLYDGRTVQIDLVSAGNDQCYVFADEEYTGTLISTDVLYGTNGIANNYDIFCKMAGIEANVVNKV